MATPALTYRFQQDQVFVGTTVSLVLEIRNDGAGPVTLKSTGSIRVSFPSGEDATALSAAVDYVPRSLTQKFTAERVEGTNDYRVRVSLTNQVIARGSSILVEFAGVKVNATKGEARVAITEQLDGAEPAQASVTLKKLPRALAVVAWLEKLVVGKGEKTRLHWQSSSAVRVVIAGFPDSPVDTDCPAGPDRQPGYRCFKVEGDPPYPGVIEVGIGPNQEQWTWTLEAVNGNGDRGKPPVLVTLTQHKPVITGFGVGPEMAQPSGKVDPTARVPLLWSTVYGRQASLVTPTNSAGDPVALNPAEPIEVSPGLDAVHGAVSWDRIPSKVDYVLRVAGFGAPADATLSFELAFAGAAYFRYSKLVNGQLSDPVFAMSPRGWPAFQAVMSRMPYTLTVWVPGGARQVLYLGPGDTSSPQVQYFAVEPGPGSKKTLHWITYNTRILTLEPGGYQVPVGEIAEGRHEIEPTQTTEYVLWATAPAPSGVVVTSSLVVTVA